MKPLRSVVLPLDGSLLSERAAPYAAFLARRSSATLHLVHAVVEKVGADRELLAAESRQSLEAVAQGFAQVGLEAIPHLVVDAPGRAILEAARSQAADMIVMATHGRSGLERLLLGSVAEEVLRQADVPVLLVPARCHRSWEDGAAKRVVVPLDGSHIAETALAPAADLAGRLDAELLLLAIERPEVLEGTASALGVRDERSRIAAAESYLDRVAATTGALGVVTHVRAIAGDPVDAVLQETRAPITAAVVMASHGRTGLTRLLLGSVTVGVLRGTEVPLLVVRAPRP